MNRKLILSLGIFFCLAFSLKAKLYETSSPDGKLKVKLQTDGQTKFEVWYDKVQLCLPSPIGLHLSDGTVVGDAAVTSVKKNRVDRRIDVAIGKNKQLKDRYNELVLSYGRDYDMVVRAYNEEWAYRFVTHWDKEITIRNEDAVFNFAFTPTVYFPECDANTSPEREQSGEVHQIHQGYRNFERLYKEYSSPGEFPEQHFSVSPVLFEYPGKPYKVVVTESDTYDYPGLYMEAAGPDAMRGKWAGYPKRVMDGDSSNPNYWYSNHLVISREDYIARTNGNRSFPWRVMIVSGQDKDLLNNELVYMLAEPCRLEDTSWIEPGKSAWEWWHKAVLEGVDFPNGNKQLSLKLYKYYVDWASEHHIPYMTLDAGWQEGYLKELCDYARQKNVKILVWTWPSCPLENPDDGIKKMHEDGVSGAKIDFFERNDQIAMRWERQLAERLARYKMVAVFHGCPVPTGLNRTYPNVMNYEAVRGAECIFLGKDHHAGVSYPFSLHPFFGRP
ncbi:MAG: glycoside hydrolase family 97 catalytic domain-containing protein [Paraprevotella sp.]|nr:glycoside hydrolase family 97 catalytic domain-containing protein [Paraprevotella sp.]